MAKFLVVSQLCVAVICSILFVGVTSQASTNVRLQGGLNRCQGRLEDFVSGQTYWRTACDERFGEEEAQVVCRQLGCPARGAMRRPVLDFGVLPRPNGQDRFFATFDRTCDGDEATLEECTQRRGTCNQGTHVRASIAVVCGGQSEIPSLPTVYDEAVRLRSGSSNCEGRLEIYIARRGLWGTACDGNFGSEEAEVVCRQLGCGTQGAARTSVQDFGPIPRRIDGGHNFRLFEHRCIGRETRIEYCSSSTSACTCSTVDSSSIGVICGNYTNEGQGDVTIPDPTNGGPTNLVATVHLLLSLSALTWMLS